MFNGETYGKGKQNKTQGSCFQPQVRVQGSLFYTMSVSTGNFPLSPDGKTGELWTCG